MTRFQTDSLQDIYPELAEIFAPHVRECNVDDVEAFLKRQLGSESIESFGSFVSQIGSGIGKVAQTAVKAMPAVLPIAGQVAGTVLGGPAGALLGGAVGRLAGGAIAGTGPRGPAAIAAPPAAPAAPAPAAAKLLSLLSRPEVLNALLSMAMGPAGNPTIQVAGNQVPVAAVANMVGSLAQQAVEEFRTATDGEGVEIPEYLTDASGNLRCDPSSADERATLLYELFADSVSTRESELDSDDVDDWEWEESDVYDDMDLGEAMANEAFSDWERS